MYDFEKLIEFGLFLLFLYMMTPVLVKLIRKTIEESTGK